MKKYIQKLALAVFACVGFASCADDFDSSDHTTYPAEAPGLGTWVADQTATSGPFTKSFLYELNITLNAAGDTVYNITSISTPYNQLQVGVYPDGTPQYLPADYPICSPAGKLQWYDPKAGTAYLEFEQTEEGNLLGVGLTPARAYLTYNRTAEKISVDMDFFAQGGWYSYESQLGNGVFTLTKAARPSFVGGYWFGQTFSDRANETKTYVFYLTYEQELMQDFTIQGQCVVSREVALDEKGNPIPEGSETPIASYGVVSDQDYCNYAYDKTTGAATVTTVPMPGTAEPEVKTYTLQYNEIGQLTFVNAEGETIILDRVAY